MMGTHGTREQATPAATTTTTTTAEPAETVQRPARAVIPRTRPAAVPDHLPRAGHDLLTGVNSVLARLAPAPNQAAIGQALADELKAALARTAACGDTCRVRAAADAVRMAVDLLLAGSAELAMPVLLSVRAELAGPHRAGEQAPTAPAVPR